MIGQKIGDYRITAPLGEGGMGVVYKAVHETLGQLVAIKMLHPALMMEERVKSRFIREAQALARLSHPNIVRLLNFIDRPDTCFIVMEFVEGKTIEKLMSELGIVPPVMAAEYFVQVLAAMQYAHSLGIIHRDIKPSNISVLPSGQVKLLDFGTAKMVGAQRLTAEGMTLGTLIYMSPEQICGRELDQRSDVYSLGVTLYEMVTGKLPHYCEDEMELVRQIAKGTPQPPSAHYKFIPPRLEKIILKAIEKDPARRYQSAEEFLKDLRAFIAEEKSREKSNTPPSGVMKVDLAQVQGAGAAVRSETPGAAAGGAASAAASGGGLQVGWLIAAVLVLAAGAGGGAALMVLRPSLHVVGIACIGTGALGGLILGVIGARGGGALAAMAAPGAAPAAGGAQPSFPPAVGEATVAQEPPPPAPAAAGHAAPVGAPAHAAAPLSAPAAHGHAAPVHAYIYAFDGPDRGRSWPLSGGAITIGRGAHNVVVLSDPGVSTTHAQITLEENHYVLTDLQSRNGSWVNNQRVARSALRDRDVIVLGTTRLAVSLGAPVSVA